MKKLLHTFPKFLLLALLIYMPVFGFLNVQPIRIYDEGRIAVNAHEMYTRGDYIVTYYENQPDMWNTKPPLLIWCQVVLMKVIGPGELAIRLPSALAAFFTCLVLLLVSMCYLKSFWLGFIAILILITSEGYIAMHGTRTGDYDALLTFFTTSGCLFFFAFSETQKIKYLYWFFVALTLGALTKGVAGLLFTPALFLYCLFQKQILILLKNKHFYAGLFSFLFIVIGYYLLREAKNPGYISTIRENELGGRFLVSQGDQKFGFWYYYENFLSSRLADRYLLVPCGILVGFFSKDPRVRKLTLFLFLMSLVFFVVISSSRTRMLWYDTPLYPFLAIFIALFIHYLFELLKNIGKMSQTISANILPFLFLFLLFIIPYKKMFMNTYIPTEAYWDFGFYDLGYFYKEAIDGKHDLNGKYLVWAGYNAHNLFYIRILKENGVKTDVKNYQDLKSGDEVIASQDTIKNYIRKNFIYSEKKEKGNVFSYRIISQAN